MILPDLLRPGLAVVFCGTAAGTRSAEAGAYYAGPGNRFWRTLYETGMTSRELRPGEFAELLAFSPRYIAFNGKNAARGALGRSVAYGVQPDRIAGSRAFVLPSTSGAARRFWDVASWHELAEATRSDPPGT